MKKSNKILLAGFLAIILLITAIHITLYAKYKNGEYTVYNREDRQPSIMQPFPNILFVTVRNIPAASVTFGEEAQVEKDEEGEDNGINYSQVGDTLMITGRYENNYRHNGHRLNFNVPYNATLSASNSGLSFKTGKPSGYNNPVIYLQKSSALFSATDHLFQLGQVKVVASDSSAILFHGNTQVDNLDVRLANSSFEFTGGNFGQLSITTDSVSRISLQSKHLSKAKITTTPN